MKRMLKQMKTPLFGIAVIVSVLLPFSDASAWVAAGRGGFGGRGFVAAGGYHGGFHGAYYGGYHGGGCYGCGAAAGAVAGLAVGAMAGAAIASTAQPAAVYVQQPAYYPQGNMPIGTQLASLPPGSSSMTVNGTNYYQNGATWYKPYFGSSGVYYEVVPAP